MNMRFVFFVVMFACGLSMVQAQGTIPIRIEGEVPVISRHDSLLFRSVFSDSLRIVMDRQTLYFLNKGICCTGGTYGTGISSDGIITSSSDLFNSFRSPVSRSWHSESTYTSIRNRAGWRDLAGRTHVLKTKADSVNNMASPRKRVKYFANLLYDTLHAHMSFSDGERMRMKNLLKDFRLRSKKLPTIYNLIDKKYGGSVDAYVDDLFDKSVFSSRRRLKWFIHTVADNRKLLSDPIVLYWTSMVQYNVLLMVADIVNE